MKVGDLAYAKNYFLEKTGWKEVAPNYLGIIVEVRDIMVGVLDNNKINWYGKPGNKTKKICKTRPYRVLYQCLKRQQHHLNNKEHK